MPDSEIFKVVLQGGSFGLLAIIVVGCLRYAPQVLTAINKLGQDHLAAVNSINEANKEAASIAAAAHVEATATMAKECREERRELVQRLIQESKNT